MIVGLAGTFPSQGVAPYEAKNFFRIMRDLTARGVSIIFIRHKLNEVLAVAGRIIVIPSG